MTSMSNVAGQTAPKTLVLRHAKVLVTMDDARREIVDGALVAVDGVVTWVGTSNDLDQAGVSANAQIIDMAGHVVTPGLINTHHHMFQTLTRAVPQAQDADLFDWLQTLYPLWAGMTPDMVKVSTQTAMAELLLSGCTTTSDHLYLYPNGSRLDDAVEGARDVGMRFHAARGAMSVGRSNGGLPPDSLIENEDAVLKDMQRLIETWNDPGRHAMLRIVVAPCSPFSVSTDLMRETAVLARHYGVSMHTHLAENDSDVAYSRERFNRTPAEYAEDLGWVGPDVWHAHCVKLDDAGISLFARTRTGVAHCACSNMRLGSGIARVRRMCDEGVPVGLGVDGSASSDASHMLAEARQALLLQRVAYGPKAMSARQALELATLGGAQVLGRDDIGALKPGMSADIAAFDVRGVSHAGAGEDLVASLVLCTPLNASACFVGGRQVVREGRLTTLDLPVHLERHRTMARTLAQHR